MLGFHCQKHNILFLEMNMPWVIDCPDLQSTIHFGMTISQTLIADRIKVRTSRDKDNFLAIQG